MSKAETTHRRFGVYAAERSHERDGEKFAKSKKKENEKASANRCHYEIRSRSWERSLLERLDYSVVCL